MDCLPIVSDPPNTAEDKVLPKKKKKMFYFQRDSLKKRNMLLVGKEGSRRRQRYDNGHFTFHPCAILHEEDLLPPGYQPYEALWSHPQVMAWLSKMTDDDVGFTGLCKEHHSSSLISHRTHQDLKKQHVPQGLVRYYEQELANFIQDDGDETMALEIDNPFTRFVIHTMCRFHQMDSYSEEQDGKYLLYITPSYLDHDEQPSILRRSFFDYLYSDVPR